MATTQHRPKAGPEARKRLLRGFDYLTLDPSPRLRKMREDQQRAAKEPAQLIAEAWLNVGQAIQGTLQAIEAGMSSPQ
jgi:hypothetical protein